MKTISRSTCGRRRRVLRGLPTIADNIGWSGCSAEAVTRLGIRLRRSAFRGGHPIPERRHGVFRVGRGAPRVSRAAGFPGLSQTLFHFGRRNAQIQGAEASYDATVAAYRQTVLTAFQEVEDDLASLRYLAEESGQQQEAVVAAEQSLKLEMAVIWREPTRISTSSRHRPLSSPTDRRRSRFCSRMLAAVNLVKALGGGWDASTLPSLEQLRSAELAKPDNTQKVARPVGK
jgi:Outer membrane efflux protein